MSGGSYNNLHHRDATDLFFYSGNLIRMAERLKELGHHNAADQTMSLFDVAEKLNSQIEMLRGVWKAVEYMDSGDSDIDDVTTEVERLNRKLY